MAEMTIRLVLDPETGKRDIIVSLRSDEDALAHEHEEHHRALVDQLIEGGLLETGEVGKIVVEREADGAPQVVDEPLSAESDRQAEGQNG